MKKILLTSLITIITTLSLQAQEEFTMKKYFFCLLKKGPTRNQDSLTTAQIQAGHLAHINKLA